MSNSLAAIRALRTYHRQNSTRVTRAWRIAGLAALVSSVFTAGCRWDENDIRQWETRQRGPYKLVAVVTHDKFPLQLRTEAALALIRMPPRGGARQGISYLIDTFRDEDGESRPGALNQLSEDSRRRIVDAMVPAIVKQLDAPTAPKSSDGHVAADPSIPFKDAAFALLVHEPSLVSNPKTRAELRASLSRWASTDFEQRVENGAQQFGLEQMIRYLGADSVRSLPKLITENASRLDRVALLISDVGDDATKRSASEALAALAARFNSRDWLAAETKFVEASNARNNVKADSGQVAGQVSKIQERHLVEVVFPAMKRVGGRPVIEYLLSFAADDAQSAERRVTALGALEGRLEKTSSVDLDRLFAIANHESTPDSVRNAVFDRIIEYPKESTSQRLYSTFDAKPWKVRWVAAQAVLKMLSSTSQVPEFLAHLPKTPAVKMGMAEPLAYAAAIKVLPGDARAALTPFLTSPELGARLTALSYFWQGKASERAVVQAFENDRRPLPSCDKADACGWACDAPGANDSTAATPKDIRTVGEFVTFCLMPSMTKAE